MWTQRFCRLKPLVNSELGVTECVDGVARCAVVTCTQHCSQLSERNTFGQSVLSHSSWRPSRVTISTCTVQHLFGEGPWRPPRHRWEAMCKLPLADDIRLIAAPPGNCKTLPTHACGIETGTDKTRLMITTKQRSAVQADRVLSCISAQHTL